METQINAEHNNPKKASKEESKKLIAKNKDFAVMEDVNKERAKLKGKVDRGPKKKREEKKGNQPYTSRLTMTPI